MINVCNTTWIMASLLKGKALLPRPFSPDPKFIFSDVTLSCADLPDGDKEAIIGAVAAMGGSESNNLTKQVTHLCALTMDNAKVTAAKEKRFKCKIVLPHWCVYFLAPTRLLPTDYCLGLTTACAWESASAKTHTYFPIPRF